MSPFRLISFVTGVIGVVALSASVSWGADEAEVREFIDRTYFHGTPYEDAKALGPEALPELERMLADPSMKSKWVRVISVIAYIGTPRSYQILRHFLWSRFQGTVDNDTWKALLSAPNMMGTIPNTPEAPIVAFLIKGTDPTYWDKLPWTVSETYGKRSETLSKMSINGLSCTGTSRAADVLAQLKQKPYFPGQMPNIEEGIRINQEVHEKGLKAYLARMHKEIGASRGTGRKK